MLKEVILLVFVVLFFYSLVRPFSSAFAKLFMLIGSVLGFASVISGSYIDLVADYLGIQGGGRDLYTYIALVTAFLFICYSWEKFKSIEKKMAIIVQELALEQSKRDTLGK